MNVKTNKNEMNNSFKLNTNGNQLKIKWGHHPLNLQKVTASFAFFFLLFST